MLDLAPMNKEQREAVETLNGPLLIIAGAGSGKTRVITYRIAKMLESGIPQSNILALTFTNKAASEMSARVREITRRKLSNLTVSTFHAFGVKILRETIHHLGFRKNFTIYDQVDKIALIKEVAKEIKFSQDAFDPKIVASLFSAIKTERTSWNKDNKLFQEFYHEYQDHLKVYNAVDFDDLITLPIKLFHDRPEVLAEYQERYKYMMIDEFQDTSLIQYRLMKQLAITNRNVCVVGDDDQSIYSWRGANFMNLVHFEQDFPELKEIKLEQNYRSTEVILEAANGVIKHNEHRKIKQLRTDTGGGNSIELCFPENERDEAQFIADRIKSLRIKQNLKYHDFGILVRTNGLTSTIEEALLGDNIPYRVSGGTSFFQRKEVKDLISYLRVLANPDDDVSLLRIINTPRRGIGKKTIALISEVAREKNSSFYSAICAIRWASDSPLAGRAVADIDNFITLIDYYRERILKGRDMAKVLKSLVENVDFWGYLLGEHQKNDKVARWKYGNIEKFINILMQWEQNPDNIDPNIFSFLNRITLTTRDDEDEENGGKVNLMTIHSAKGLEFNTVFLAGVEENIIPHARSLEEQEGNLEEERRLFYVAITRAKQKLYMSACRERKVMRELTCPKPSPFIEEIPQELISYYEPEEVVQNDEVDELFSKIKQKFA
ncbi:MAG: ATP-dependent helicase [Spirochaetia bacterium]